MKAVAFLLLVVALIAVTCFVLLRYFDSPNVQPAVHTTFHAVHIIGGVILLFPLVDNKRKRAGWARLSFGVAGVLAIIIGTADLLRQFGVFNLTAELSKVFTADATFLAGTVVGIILALVFSGELFGRKLTAA